MRRAKRAKKKRKATALPSRRSGFELSAEWLAWLAENRLRGLSAEVLVDRLRKEGVPKKQALAALASMERSPTFAGARRIARRAHQLSLLAKLRSELERSATKPTEVLRAATPEPEAFIDRYFATGTPVVLTDFTRRWRALTRWTPEYLRDRFGDAEVEIVDGRDGDPRCDENHEAHRRKASLRSYVDRILAAGKTNDFYMIAQNRNLEKTALGALFEDVEFPDYLDGPRAPHGSALWLGPAGTVTPLHHDTSSILFCQIYGRKRVVLVSPFETVLLDAPRGVYSNFDCEAAELAPELAAVTRKVVDLAPGETLFIPVGWWHHVRALDVSISLALNNFRVHNDYEWYKPGLLG
jgi:hypothetical protein